MTWKQFTITYVTYDNNEKQLLRVESILGPTM